MLPGMSPPPTRTPGDGASDGGGEGDDPIERLRLRGFHIAADALAQQREQRASSDAPAERSHQTAMDPLHYSPLKIIDVVLRDDDDNRHPEEEIEGREGGLWDHAVTDDNGELDEKKEAVRQDSYAAPWDSSGASAAIDAAAVEPRLRLYGRMIGDDFHAERVCTRMLTPGEESPSPSATCPAAWAAPPPAAAPDDASSAGHTYDDIIKSPPLHLRCVISPLSSLPLVLRCTAASLPRFCRRRAAGLRRVQAVLCTCSSRGCHHSDA